MSQKNYITPKGFEVLRSELKKLLYTERPEIVKVISWAASNGDRSENGDYIYGKRRLREIDRRIRFLQKRIEAAEVVNPALQSGEKVLFGAKVEYEDEEGSVRKIRIVGVDETNPSKGEVSWISPLAQIFFQKKVGDSVVFRSPKKPEGEELVILSVSFGE